MNNKGVVVGMSGGVDSSVSAARMHEMGYAVCGATLVLTDRLCGACENCGQDCAHKSDAEQAADLCAQFGFLHQTIDAQDKFFNMVVKRFGEEYARGRTPNPCVLCNKFIKFPSLLELADRLGVEYIATGHYAEAELDRETGRYLLKKSKNIQKDQSYVLYSLSQQVLSRVMFPIGSELKSDVKAYAGHMDFESARRKESQDICFVKDGDYAGFLKDKLGIDTPEGNFEDKRGRILGRHKGIINYTVGQRKGLGIASTEPYYVVEKDYENNRVVLGRKDDLYSDTVTVRDVNFISIESLEHNMRAAVKTRYSRNEALAEIAPGLDGTVKIKFDAPQRALTPGQAAVFYDGDIVVGGGTIV